MNRALLAIALATSSVTAGCLIDRSPLAVAPVMRDAYVADADEDAPSELPDAWIAPGEDAGLDAALEPDAWEAPDAWVPIDAPCVVSCMGTTLVTSCPSSGEDVAMPCPLGCDGAGPEAPHCMRFDPSNATPSIFDRADSSMVVAVGEMRTLDTGACPAAAIVRMSDGVSQACLYLHDRIEIAGTLVLRGTLPAMLLARDEIVLSGTLDVSAQGTTPGAGGGAGGTGAGGSGTGMSEGGGGSHDGSGDGGGGGGGLCGSGARGGHGGNGLIGTATVAGGAAGSATGSFPSWEPLRGGGGGGAGNGGSRWGAGGAGGGAVQLSTRGRLAFSGTIRAGGGGGRPGTSGGGEDGSGGGGGAGGWVLLEATSYEIGASATIVANGGGGGGGAAVRSDDSGNGQPGQDGVMLGAAAGGPGGAVAGGAGGAGSSAGGQQGGDNINDNGNGGGGGGGAGCVVLRSRTSPLLIPMVSPTTTGLVQLPVMLD